MRKYFLVFVLANIFIVGAKAEQGQQTEQVEFCGQKISLDATKVKCSNDSITDLSPLNNASEQWSNGEHGRKACRA